MNIKDALLKDILAAHQKGLTIYAGGAQIKSMDNMVMPKHDDSCVCLAAAACIGENYENQYDLLVGDRAKIVANKFSITEIEARSIEEGFMKLTTKGIDVSSPFYQIGFEVRDEVENLGIYSEV